MENHDKKVRQLKLRMLEAAYKNQQGFLASSFSIIDILVSLYYEVMQYDSKAKEYRDEFVLSKGHAALALYSILEDKNIISEKGLEIWGRYRSGLCLMADRKVPGVTFSTGSLGHGLPEAVGLAYAKKVQNIEGKVFVLVGDGEMNEGSNWEAVQIASRMHLDHLVCIVDYNASSLFSKDQRELKEKFESFDCIVEKVDGHNGKELAEVLKKSSAGHVRVIIADTIKGKGCLEMEKNPALWHSKAPNEAEYNAMTKEVAENDESFC